MFTFENEQVNVYVDRRRRVASQSRKAPYSRLRPAPLVHHPGHLHPDQHHVLLQGEQTGSMLASETGGCLRRHGVATLESNYYTALSCAARPPSSAGHDRGSARGLGLGVLVLFSVLTRPG